MLRKLRNVPGLWRLCIVLCLPVALAILAYYAMLDDEPQTPVMAYQTAKDYSDFRDLRVVYNSDWIEGKPYGSWNAVDTLIGRAGARWMSAGRAMLIDTPGISDQAWERAKADIRRYSNEREWARVQRQLWRVAFWLSLAIAPFAAFWAIVFANRWVQAGFVSSDEQTR